MRISRDNYIKAFGPTVGDQVRLGNTDLWIEVTHDLTFGGDEAIFGGGKSIRESMLQGLTTSAPTDSEAGAPDTVITNVVILDAKSAVTKGPRSDTEYVIVRADVGIKDGKIVAIGKSGNPDVSDGVDEKLHIGPSTDIVAGEGKILTAGAIDTHVHYLSPSIVMEAVATGITTVVGGGVGPSEGSKATTVSPGPWHLINSHRSFDPLPVNVLLLGKGNTVNQHALEEQALAGAGGYKVHEDWGATPAAIDAALTAAETWQLQVALHADSLNEAGFLEQTAEAFDDRTIHVFHAEGAGGGHAPDIMALAGNDNTNVLPASTNPTLPFTGNTKPEHLDMLAAAHHLDLGSPTDFAFADSRVRAATMAAEDILHDMGAISITSSDAQAMGRVGEVITRTWQVAHVMKAHRGHLDDRDSKAPADNQRALRYVAKYTINPALAHGIDDYVGSVEPGKLADLVLWDPRFFGVRPEMVMKGGAMVRGNLGEPNASVATPQPTFMRPAMADAIAADVSYSFVSPAAFYDGYYKGGGEEATRWGKWAAGFAEAAEPSAVPGWTQPTMPSPPTWADSERTAQPTPPTAPALDRLRDGTVLPEILGLRRLLVPVKETRTVRKTGMVFNGATPVIHIDADGFKVRVGSKGTAWADLEVIDDKSPWVDMDQLDPANPGKKQKLPLAQLYSMF